MHGGGGTLAPKLAPFFSYATDSDAEAVCRAVVLIFVVSGLF